MPDAKPFLDTNVVLYLLSADAAKADRAEELLAGGGIISVQVLNEFAAVASRKLVYRFIKTYLLAMPCVMLTAWLENRFVPN